MNTLVSSVTKWLTFRFPTKTPGILLIFIQMHFKRLFVKHCSIVLLQVRGLRRFQNVYRKFLLERRFITEKLSIQKHSFNEIQYLYIFYCHLPTAVALFSTSFVIFFYSRRFLIIMQLA